MWITTRKREIIKPTVWAILSSPRDRVALFDFYVSTKGNVTMKKIAVIMGSDSDLPVAEKAIHTLASYGVPYEVHV